MASLRTTLIPPTCKQWHVAQSNCQNRHALNELTESAFSHLSRPYYITLFLLSFCCWFIGREKEKSCTCSQCTFVWALVFPVVFSLIKQTKYILFFLFFISSIEWCYPLFNPSRVFIHSMFSSIKVKIGYIIISLIPVKMYNCLQYHNYFYHLWLIYLFVGIQSSTSLVVALMKKKVQASYCSIHN